MSDLKQGLPRIHGYYPSHNHNRFSNPIYENTTTTTTTTASMTNYGRQGRSRAPPRNYENYGGGGIEFGSQKGGGDEESSGVVSPPLWKSSPSSSPSTAETTPLQSHQYYDHHNHYRLLSPESRTQAILRGRQELMEMVKQMPETSYELSLKDLVELPKAEVLGRTTLAEEREKRDGAIVKESERQKWKKYNKNNKNDRGRSVSRSGSTGRNGPFLLKMFFPISLGWKKKTSPPTGTCSKVSPRPMPVPVPVPVPVGEKSEKDWWKKRLTVVGEYGSSRSGSSSSSGGGSINSASTSTTRNKRRGFVPACWTFIWTR